MWRLWGWASLWVVGGSICLGALRVGGVDFGSGSLVLYAVGIALVTAGPWYLLVGLQRVSRVERVLSIHQEGLRWEDGDTIAYVRWDELDEILVEEDALTLVAGSRRVELPSPMEGIVGTTLQRLLIDMQRRALMGLPVSKSHTDRSI